MPGLVIDWMQLEVAFESHDPEASVWLDKRSGSLVARNDLVAEDGEHYLRVEAIPSREQYRMMERFIATVTNTALRDALQDAIVGKGAFRRFKDAVGRHADEHKRWFAFRDALLHRFILDWLKANRLELQEVPAWNLEPPMTPAPEPPEGVLLTSTLLSSPLPFSSVPFSSLASSSLPISQPPAVVIAERYERAEADNLRTYLQSWARAHGEEYRYLFGPAAFERLATDLAQEFSLTRKRNTP